MQAWLLGLPLSGKTTVFRALTGGSGRGSPPPGRAGAQLAVVRVPDRRLESLSAMFQPRKTTFADVTYLDPPAIPIGARPTALDPELLTQVRDADALLHVVRGFDDPANARPADPWRDAGELELELVLADLSVVEKRIEKLSTSGRHGTPAERAANATEEAVLGDLQPKLAVGQPVRTVKLDEEAERVLRGFAFLSQKPALVIVNVDESRLPAAAELEAEGRRRLGGSGTDVAVLAGKIEAEIAELEEAEAQAFLDDLAIAEPSRTRVIHLTYGLLGLSSFFTVGEDECRAWTVRRGATAVDAAGAIHSDLARGFIRAEVVSFEDLEACGSLAEARRRGLLRSEGKGYPVRDGDVVNVLFNVAR